MSGETGRTGNEMLAEILTDLRERGMENIVTHRGGDYIHVSAYDPKRKRDINVHARPEKTNVKSYHL